jgi:hypothetical protein
LAAACVVAFVWKLRIVAPIQYVGHADAAGYAEMAHSLIQGRGLEVDYISWYFRKYDAGIVRPEDHWPPLYSFLVVPFFLTMGRTALAAKMPSLLISAFAFPGVTAALAWRVSRSRAVALASGLCVLLYTPIFSMSLHCLSDVTFGFLVVGALLCAVVAEGRPRWHVGVGVLLALAYYAKGSTIVLAPAFALYYLARRARRGAEPLWSGADRWVALSWAVFALLLAPWVARNLTHFGEPLYSTQSHAAGYIGWKSWEEGTYSLYWGDEPPSLGDKLEDPARLAQTSVRHTKRHAWWLFARHGKNWGDFAVADISTYWLGIACLIGAAMVTVGAAWRWLTRRRARDADRSAGIASVAPYGLFALVALAHVGFLSVCWEPISRLLMPLLPLVILGGWHTIHAVSARIAAASGGGRRFGAVVVLAALALWSEHELRDLWQLRENGGYAWREGGQGWMDVGRWLQENAPGSVTMTRNPWELHFYSQESAVQIPLAPLDRISEVARYYGVTHLIPEARRPMLAPLLSGEAPGLTEEFRSHDVVLYRFDPYAAAASER